MSVTIKQIAEMAGVHRSTVDKVLHNRPGVSDSVRRRVKELLAEYQYEANPIGKALKMQEKELRIAVLLLKVDAMPYIKKGIENTRKNYGAFQIHLMEEESSYTDTARQRLLLARCREEKVDGILISPIHCPQIVQEIHCCAEAGIPVVTVNLDAADSGRFCFIGQDGYKAGRVAARFMGGFLQGRGKVGLITNSKDRHHSFPFGTREDGFRSGIREGYPQIQLLESRYCEEDPEKMRQEVAALLEREPSLDGLLITCGCVPAACEVIRQKGREDICLICYEDYPEIRKLLQEGIVTLTLACGLRQQGAEGLEVLLDRMIYGREPETDHRYMQLIPMVKESL